MRDGEQPGAIAAARLEPIGEPDDAQEHFLGQVVRHVGPGGPAEVGLHGRTVRVGERGSDGSTRPWVRSHWL